VKEGGAYLQVVQAILALAPTLTFFFAFAVSLSLFCFKVFPFPDFSDTEALRLPLMSRVVAGG